MSDQADLNKVIEDVLLSAFENNQHDQQQQHQDRDENIHDDNSNENNDNSNEEEIDYEKQLQDLLGQVDAHSSNDHISSSIDEQHTEIPQHEPQQDTHHEEASDGHDEYQIDFANVVQGIMDQYGEEEEEEEEEGREVKQDVIEQQQQQEEVPSELKEHQEDEVQKIQEQPDHQLINDSINEVVNDHTVIDHENKKEYHDHDNNDDDEHNFQDILAQLASEVADKVQDDTHDVHEEIHAPFEQQISKPTPPAPAPVPPPPAPPKPQPKVDREPLIDAQFRPEHLQQHPIPTVPRVTPKPVKKVQKKKELPKPHIDDHEKELQDAIADALRSTKLEQHLEPQRNEIVKEKPKPKQLKLAKKPQHEPKSKAPQVNLKADNINESFFGELDQLAGDSEQPDDLQAALAQMVQNVVEGNESDFYDSDDYNSSDSDGDLLIDQSQMNEILHNAFQLAMNQQSGDEPHRDIDTNLHKAALDEAISSFFGGDKSKLKQLPKLKKELSSAMAKKKLEKTVKTPKTFKETLAKPKKTYSRKKTIEKPETDKISKLENVTSETSAPKKKSKLSIAETLALTRSTMKAASSKNYSGVETVDPALKTGEKANQPQGPKQPGVTTFQSSASKKSTLEEAIQQMSNALAAQAKSQSSPDTQLLIQKSTTVPKAKESGDQGLLDVLLMTKDFMSRESVDNNTAQTLSVIDTAIESLRRPEVTPTKTPTTTTTTLASTANMPFNNTTTSSMTAAITQAFSNFADSIAASGGVSTGQQKRHKIKIDAPELKERIRQSNRERKKRWREINAERNKDNDLRFRVVKRANQLFGDGDNEQKSKWILEELEKRRKKRQERLSHSLRPDFDFNTQNNNNNNNNNNKPEAQAPRTKVKAENSPSSLLNPVLIKSIMDLFGLRNVNTSLASAVAASAILAFKSNSTDHQQIKNAINKAVASVVNKTPRESPSGVVSSFKVQTLNDFAKNSSVKEPLKNVEATDKDVVPPSRYPDPELTNMLKNHVTINKKALDDRSSPSLAAAESARKMMEQQKIGIANSLKNLTLNNSNNNAPNFTTTPQSEKRRSEENIFNDKSKKPRSVSPPPSKISEILKDSSESEELKHDISKKPSISFLPQTLRSTPTSTKPLVSVIQQTQQQPQSIVEPFKMLWSSRTMFRLPQYKKPGSSPNRSPAPASSSSSSSTTTNSSPSQTQQAPPVKRPLQRPGFSKPSAYSRPRW